MMQTQGACLLSCYSTSGSLEREQPKEAAVTVAQSETSVL